MESVRAVFERTPLEGRKPKRQGGARNRLLRSLARARQQMQGMSGAMPSTTTQAAKGHHVISWVAQGRQKLILEALHLGVLVSGATPEAVGKPGVGQFRTWKSLGAAVQRARAAS